MHTACMSAPFPPDPPATATALLSLPKFGFFTTIWEEPYSSDAVRFSADIIAVRGNHLNRIVIERVSLN
jgi:hypothetical protein